MIRHGGDLSRAISIYGGDANDWLDLSTGISPWSYPICQFSPDTWRDLPPPIYELLETAASYYQCDTKDIIATPGSQLAIRLIPQFYKSPMRVALPVIGYQEHAHSWRQAGHRIHGYRNIAELEDLVLTQQIEHCVVINPNNPTAEFVSNDQLQTLSRKLSGLMIVDEAFSDLANAVLDYEEHGNIVRLKSLGKFFGLAGARIGFVISKHPILKQLNHLLEPWSLSAPSIELACQALDDSQWQHEQRARINHHAKLQRNLMSLVSACLEHARLVDQGLFFSVFAKHECIEELHNALAQKRVWSRLGDKYTSVHGGSENWLRLSLAGNRLADLANALDINLPVLRKEKI